MADDLFKVCALFFYASSASQVMHMLHHRHSTHTPGHRCKAAMPNVKSFGTMIIAYGMCDALCAAVNSLGGNDPSMFEAFRKMQQMLALAADVADPSRQFELHLFRKDSLPSDVPLGNRRNLVTLVR